LSRNGMFGKRGENPPLPRNCDSRTLVLQISQNGVNASQRCSH
jgi:hypothetical protein